MEADIIYKALAKVTLNNPFEYIFVHCSCSKINTKWEQWDTTTHYPSTLSTIPRHCHYPSTLPLVYCVPGQYPLADTDLFRSKFSLLRKWSIVNWILPAHPRS
jgi:hypothetical protein